jgi:hypothetical protein
MSRSRLLRRFIAASTIGALALLGPHLVLSAADAADDCAMSRHGCGRLSLAACCCPAADLPRATPPQASAASTAPTMQASAAPVAVAPAPAALHARLVTPTRGFVRSDLTLLLSTLLI